MTAFCSSTAANAGFEATVARDLAASNYRPASVFAKVRLADDAAKRTSVFYVGPKKQSLLWDLGMKDVMEFGMWRWLCYPLVWVLNFFNNMIPNYGVAIILLTILVRLLFWPLTHKSTVGMKKMQELQPKMKEIQAKFKDNPQRMQQETWALYRENKVNPMSSCLPMLIQIPVFIALFNVLRSAVELRYAPFLWIGDLSEPEALELVPVRRAQHPPDTDGRLHGAPERVHAFDRRQEPAEDDDDLHAAHDALHVLLVPVGALALLVPLEPLLHRADVDHPSPDGGQDGREGRSPYGRGDRPASHAADAPPRKVI